MDTDKSKDEGNVIRYIIVVHGIGEQRKNETVLSVVNRFAEIRAGTSPEETFEILPLGKATGQTGYYDDPKSNFTPWMEFKGIPQDPNEKTTGPFYGERSYDGTQLRFVDLTWADIMQEDWPHVGMPVENWAKGLIGRLKRKDDHAKKHNSSERVPQWILLVLDKLAETLILARRIMIPLINRFTGLITKIDKTEDLVFNKFLGDVQLYGEYPRTRGRAVRRFHNLMNLIDKKHREQEEEKQIKDSNYIKVEPKYTILAHSLGTVMSMDALVSAHIDLATRSGFQMGIPNFPFPGYCQKTPKEIKATEVEIKRLQEEIKLKEAKDQSTDKEKEQLDKERLKIEYLDTGWIECVDSFVTLGSPIDKFLILWWLNYQYLNDKYWESFPRDDAVKISHFNYTDEQDPVGHALDKFQATKAYKNIFKKAEDRVFNRYKFPGIAHVDYWKDLDLFRHIADKAIDKQNSTSNDPALKEPQWFNLPAYGWALKFTYFSVPLLLTFSIPLALNEISKVDGVFKQAITIVTVFLVIYLGKRVIDLMLWWRLVMRAKAHKHFVDKKAELEFEKDKKKKEQESEERNQKIRNLDKELEEYSIRTMAAKKAIGKILFRPVFLGVLTIVYFGMTQYFPQLFNWIPVAYQAPIKINILIFLVTGTLVFSYVTGRYLNIKNFFKSLTTDKT